MSENKYQLLVNKGTAGFALFTIKSIVMNAFPNVNWYNLPLFILAVGLLMWAIFDFIFIHLKWSLYKSWSFPSLLPFRILIPLKNAAQKAYDVYDSKHLLEMLNTGNGLNNERDMRLQWVACKLSQGKTVYGKYSNLSNKLIPIPPNSGSISDDCCSIVNNGELKYSDLKIDRNDVKKFIKSVKNDGISGPW